MSRPLLCAECRIRQSSVTLKLRSSSHLRAKQAKGWRHSGNAGLSRAK